MTESAVSPVTGTLAQNTPLRSLDDLPGPRGLPLLGNALDIKPKELHRLLGRWANQFGPLFVFGVGSTRVLTIVEPDTIQHILRDRPDRFRRWRRMEGLARDIKADGLFTAEGEKWRRQRKFVMYALNAGHVREFVPRLEEVIGRLRRRWWRHALSSATFDAHTDLMRLTVDVASGLAFGRDLNTLEEKADPIQKHLDKIFPAVARRLMAPFPYWRYLPLAADRDVADAVTQVGKLIDALIAETRERLTATPELQARPRNLLEALVAAQARGDDGPSDEEISANVMTMLLAGEDTTANSLSYMMHFLMQYPHVQAAIQEEVDRVIGIAEHSWQDPSTLERLRYIEAFAHEAMRCKPVAGHVSFLEPNENVQIHDVFVPRGTPILVLNAHLGTQAANFSEPDAFRPERWLLADDAPETVHNTKAFMPFGAGPRFCPGRYLAMMQIKMFIAMLCRDFEVVRPADAPGMEDIYNFTVGPTSVYALLRPRRPARRGIDVEFRDATRRSFAAPIAFPDRRVAERRRPHAAAAY